jgi:ABC-type transporter lipoprotein component MlaA
MNLIIFREIKLFLILAFLLFFTKNLQAFANEEELLENNSTNSSQEEYYDDFDDFDDFSINKKDDQENDPFEKINRKIYVFNDVFDRYFFEHVARSYRIILPKTARSSIRNFLNNISAPMSLVNSLLQGKTDNSLATLSSFLINSTIGLGGIFDVAEKKNINYNDEDFGQTLGYYGVGSGSYLMIPFLGSSSTRNFSGRIFDNVFNPTVLTP